MKIKDCLLYILINIVIFLGLSGIEFFVLKPLVDFISTSFWLHLCFYIGCLIIVNPLILILIGKILPFNPPELVEQTSIDE